MDEEISIRGGKDVIMMEREKENARHRYRERQLGIAKKNKTSEKKPGKEQVIKTRNEIKVKYQENKTSGMNYLDQIENTDSEKIYDVEATKIKRPDLSGTNTISVKYRNKKSSNKKTKKLYARTLKSGSVKYSDGNESSDCNSHDQNFDKHRKFERYSKFGDETNGKILTQGYMFFV